MFSILSSKVKKNNLLKPNTGVIFSTAWFFQIATHFLAFLLLCGLVSNDLQFFPGIQKYVWQGVIYTVNFSYLEKISKILFNEIFVREDIVLKL